MQEIYLKDWQNITSNFSLICTSETPRKMHALKSQLEGILFSSPLGKLPPISKSLTGCFDLCSDCCWLVVVALNVLPLWSLSILFGHMD